MEDRATDDVATSAEPTSLRDELATAYDKAMDTPEPTDTPKVDEPKTEEPDKPDDDVKAEDKPEDDKPDEDKKDEPKTIKAPASWSPAAREKFADLPEDIREEVLRVEGEAGKKFREGAQARGIAEEFIKTVEPYRDVIEKAGVTPFAAVQEVLEVAKRLSTGTPKQKAAVLAELVSHHDIDVADLDEILTERIKAPKPSRTEQTILQELQQLKTRLAPSPAPGPGASPEDSAVNTAIESFANDPKNEFFNDVSADMALLFDSGRAKDLKQCYDMAVRMNEGVQKVIADRKAKEAQRVNAAQASVKGSAPKAKQTTAKDLSLRDTLSQAFDEVMGG